MFRISKYFSPCPDDAADEIGGGVPHVQDPLEPDHFPASAVDVIIAGQFRYKFSQILFKIHLASEDAFAHIG
jgi:hypothetical protein